MICATVLRNRGSNKDHTSKPQLKLYRFDNNSMPENLWNDRMRKARESLDLKRNEFARRVGVSAATVSDWESGKIKHLSSENLAKVSQVLGISPEYILSGRTAAESKPSTKGRWIDGFDLTDDQKDTILKTVDDFEIENERARDIVRQLDASKTRRKKAC